MKQKYYFEDEYSEICYTADYFLENTEDDVTEIEVFEAIPEKDTGFYWCKHFQDVGDKTEGTCGKGCAYYTPRNGKSGCCKYYSNITYSHGVPVILKAKP